MCAGDLNLRSKPAAQAFSCPTSSLPHSQHLALSLQALTCCFLYQ